MQTGSGPEPECVSVCVCVCVCVLSFKVIYFHAVENWTPVLKAAVMQQSDLHYFHSLFFKL